MWSFFERFSDRRSYRLVSSLLTAAILFPVLFLVSIGQTWEWALSALAVGTLGYVVLVILTYFRLRDAGRSGWWLLPMIFVINIGPRWILGSWGSASATFSPTQLVSLIPVIIGWVAVSRSRAPSISEAQTG